MTDSARTLWRITTRRFAASAFTGEGARRYGGRWNRAGQSMVYTAESRSLALLEMLVQDDPLRAQYVLIPAHLPSTVSVEQIGATALPEDWRGLAARDQLQMVGSEWLHEARSCVLAVPSVVMPAEQNYLINPLHPDFRHITLGPPEALEMDLRLLRNLSDAS